jgi:hypothetical protein
VISGKEMLLSLLSPEARLLFLAAGDSSADAEILRMLKEKIDWLELCRLAEREKALAPLWSRLERVAEGDVPPEVKTHLKRLARVTMFHMSYLEQLVLSSATCLDRRGIDYTLLKGAALACSVYGSFNQRPMVDVDLLVREADAERAVDALLSAGWMWQANKSRDADYSHLHHLPALVDPNGLVSAEIHISILPHAAPFGITTDEILASSRSVDFQGSKVSVPDPLHLLLHACIHFAWSHLFRTGAWRTFRDVRKLTDANLLDWNDFIRLARDHRARTCCYWALKLARELTGARIPNEVLSELRPPLPSVVMRTLERHFALILVPSGTPCPSVTLRRAMWSAAILPGRNGHSKSRPWEVLALRPEDRRSREKPGDASNQRRARKVSAEWARYWSSVLLAPSANYQSAKS